MAQVFNIGVSPFSPGLAHIGISMSGTDRVVESRGDACLARNTARSQTVASEPDPYPEFDTIPF